jgi:hypothetical protein
MKKFVFTIVLVRNGRTSERSHVEKIPSEEEAKIRAREIFAECKRDKVNVMQVNVYEMVHCFAIR